MNEHVAGVIRVSVPFTQLALFHKVIPELARDFTVYAVDLPGHGYSDIPDGPYDANFFYQIRRAIRRGA